jgi:lipid-A-disaccharide synthase
MAEAGVSIRWDAATLGTMGFLEALGGLPGHLAFYRAVMSEARAGRYDAAVLIDYPGFHLRLGAALRTAGVPVLQFVAPQLWAWRPERIRRLRAAADCVAALLPFEEQWFRTRGIPCRFVGHPVADRVWRSRAEARARLALPLDLPVLGIFPGSRELEITRNWPLFRDVGHRMLAEGRCRQVVVAGTPGGYYPDAMPFRIQREAADLVLAAATAALVKSGTTVLEAAWTNTPVVVAYRTARATYEIARRLMKVQWISLANLVLEEPVVPEFWRLPVRAADVAGALRPLLDDASPEAARQLVAFERLRDRFGPGGAADRAAEIALGLVGDR